ncbi:hypothetical protein [Rubrivivax gelatinosus]|uniref:RiboL-PSP-HEPN domain-containing protein n=1 Tax=Rubrivivax gelatinosus TaxID=28068 RepID=A0ABS1DPR5_RUBGE|nr:hypothetical protein [Rubrivivax gelatinosus]MBK1711972.1 hypothetical protein [Rubrivivax gelatinosus]
MDTPEDVARDEAIADLVDEAIEEFTLERLRSYYLAHPKLAIPAFAMYDEALASLAVSKSAALVLCTTAIELGLKVTLLRPVVYGLVHNESVADLVSDLVAKQSGYDRFMPLLARVVSEYGGIDLDVLKMEGHATTIWEEIKIIQAKRNAVVHQGVPATLDDVTLALQIGGYVLGMFLSSVLKRFGLALDKKMVIANV